MTVSMAQCCSAKECRQTPTAEGAPAKGAVQVLSPQGRESTVLPPGPILSLPAAPQGGSATGLESPRDTPALYQTTPEPPTLQIVCINPPPLKEGSLRRVAPRHLPTRCTPPDASRPDTSRHVVRPLTRRAPTPRTTPPDVPSGVIWCQTRLLEYRLQTLCTTNGRDLFIVDTGVGEERCARGRGRLSPFSRPPPLP